jgi:hypothetical protein
MTAPQPPYEQPYPPPAQYYYAPPVVISSAPAGTNGLGIAGMVLGIVALVLVWVPGLDLLLGVLATVFSGIGLHKATREDSSKGMSIAGLSTGIIAVILSVLYWIVVATASSP